MKRIITRFVLLSMSWMILGSAKPAKQTHFTAATPAAATLPATKPAFDGYYYWYYVGNDSFLFLETTADAINDLEMMFAVIVNRNLVGGTPIAKGYQNMNEPHDSPVQQILYQH